jgi:glucose-1-phosphate adenylyltransferase
MGNYVFDTETLVDIVTPTADEEQPTDIGGDVIPALTREGVAWMYDFGKNDVPGQAEHERGYWRDVGSLDAYYDANMDLLRSVPPFSLYNRKWPVYSLQLPLPPAKIDRGPQGQQALVMNSLLCAGSIVSGGQVEHSIVSPECYVDGSAQVTESILFPGVRVGPGARIHRAVIDKNVEIPAGMALGVDLAHDAEHFSVSANGVVIVEKGHEFR